MLKRFISEDPIGLNGGINVYQYVGAMPTMLVDPIGLYWFAQPWQTDHPVGSWNTPVEPGSPVGVFIENYVPAGYTFGQIHDGFVDLTTGAGLPFHLVNIPSMIPAYVAAVATEIFRTLGMLPQPPCP